MSRPKVSLKSFFVVITLAAVTSIEFVVGAEATRGVLRVATMLIMTMCPVAAFYRRDRHRAFWLGASCGGIGFLLLGDKLRMPWSIRGGERNWILGDEALQPLDLGVYLSNAWWTLMFALAGGLIAKYVIYRDPNTETNA